MMRDGHARVLLMPRKSCQQAPKTQSRRLRNRSSMPAPRRGRQPYRRRTRADNVAIADDI